ncbi:MAG: PilX N-terminal domain-containing pilus assembly protein [Pseudomonadota bacterium]|nr:PilX N-terminal domain-containing pilus assembly protein [Pseudomonadota bacterium]
MKRERGSILLISLVMLLILTIVGIASISGVSMTEKMTNSQRDYDIAFEMAEAALVQGERWLDDYDDGWDHSHLNCSSGSACFTANCTGGLCFRGSYPSASNSLCEVNSYDNNGKPVWQSSAIWDANAATYSVSIPAVEAPKYLIEFLCYTPRDPTSYTEPPDYTSWVRIYRVTALAYGTHPETRVMLQSTYRVD